MNGIYLKEKQKQHPTYSMNKIKNLKPNPNSQYRQGYFKPTNLEKYKGDPSVIIYRSMWEHRFMTWCDLHTNITSWCSEPIGIPFLNPCAKLVNGMYQSAIHNYYVDFYITVQKDEKVSESWLIEIKPGMQVPTTEQLLRLSKMITEGNKTDKKIRRYNHELKTLLVNRAKFLAAKKFAEERGCKFAVCDEHFLF
jgi:hypothetical protein